MTRILFFVLLLCVAVAYAVNLGLIQGKPFDNGRQPVKTTQELKGDSVTLGKPK